MIWPDSEIFENKKRIRVLEQKVEELEMGMEALATVLNIVSSRPDVDVPAALEKVMAEKRTSGNRGKR